MALFRILTKPLAPIWTLHKTRMSHRVRSLQLVLIEHTSIALDPIFWVLWISAIIHLQREQSKTVIWVVAPRSTVDDELLTSNRTRQLLRTLVTRQSHIARYCTSIWRLFPRLRRHTDDGTLRDIAAHSRGVAHGCDAEVGGPRHVGAVPAGVDMVELGVQLEVCAVNCELVIGVQLGGEGVCRGPDVRAGGDECVHAVVDGGTVKGTVHAGLWWRVVAVGVSCEDDIPQSIDEMDFWSPDIGAVGLASRRQPELLGVGVVPVGQDGASE